MPASCGPSGLGAGLTHPDPEGGASFPDGQGWDWLVLCGVAAQTPWRPVQVRALEPQ